MLFYLQFISILSTLSLQSSDELSWTLLLAKALLSDLILLELICVAYHIVLEGLIGSMILIKVCRMTLGKVQFYRQLSLTDPNIKSQ